MESEEKTRKDFSWQKLIFVFVFFLITPVALFASVLSLVAISSDTKNFQTVSQNIITSPVAGVQVYASLPNDFPSVYGEVVEADARPEIIKTYLKENQSPLTPYAAFIVQTADKYKIDWRLITAIAMKESGLCRIIPPSSHNCWGWGIHSKGTLGFDSYEEGIETVTKGLKDNYIDIGLTTPEKIMTKYAHPDSTTWAEGVSTYMSELQ